MSLSLSGFSVIYATEIILAGKLWLLQSHQNKLQSEGPVLKWFSGCCGRWEPGIWGEEEEGSSEERSLAHLITGSLGNSMTAGSVQPSQTGSQLLRQKMIIHQEDHPINVILCRNCWRDYLCIAFTLLFFFFFFLGSNLCHVEVPWLGGLIRAAAAGLHHSHGKAGSKPHLWLMLQLLATLKP